MYIYTRIWRTYIQMYWCISWYFSNGALTHLKDLHTSKSPSYMWRTWTNLKALEASKGPPHIWRPLAHVKSLHTVEGTWHMWSPLNHHLKPLHHVHTHLKALGTCEVPSHSWRHLTHVKSLKSSFEALTSCPYTSEVPWFVSLRIGQGLHTLFSSRRFHTHVINMRFHTQ